MQVIFPAQNAAIELQIAVHAFLADKKNEWFAYQIDSKLHESRQIQLRQHVVRLSNAIERFKSRVHIAVRDLHSTTQPFQARPDVMVFNPEVDGERYLSLCRLWDGLMEWKPVLLTDIPANASVEQLENYISTMITALKTAVQQYGLRHPLKLLGLKSFECPAHAGFNIPKSFLVVRAILSDALEQQLTWVQKGGNDCSNLEHVLTHECHFNFTDIGPQTHKRHRDFMREVIAPLQTAVEDWVKKIIPERTWSVWTIRDLSFDLVLEQGKDFRILDWEKRMASGQWEMTDAASLIGTPGTAEKEDVFTDIVEKQTQDHYQHLDPRVRAMLLQKISSIPQKHVVASGIGVPVRKQDVNIVVDPIPRYSFFLKDPLPTDKDNHPSEFTRSMKDLIGTELPERQTLWPVPNIAYGNQASLARVAVDRLLGPRGKIQD